MKQSRKILVVAPSWIGDLIISQSFFKKLKLVEKEITIDVIVRSNLFPIIDMMPQVNKKFVLDIPHRSLGLLDRYHLSRSIKTDLYDEAYILTNSLKSAIVPWLARIPIRTGYLGEMRYGLINKVYREKKFKVSMANRFLKLIDSVYQENIMPELYLKEEQYKKIMVKFKIDKNCKNIFLCPDAEYGEAKRWPIEKWCELADKLVQMNHRIYFIGKSTNIKQYIDKILARTPNIISLINKTTIEEAVYLLASSNLVITNDSGLMHVASSVNAKIVAIFGSSSPKYTPPLSKEGYSEIIYRNLSCSPCFKKTCPLGHMNCLVSITADEIVTKASQLL